MTRGQRQLAWPLLGLLVWSGACHRVQPPARSAELATSATPATPATPAPPAAPGLAPQTELNLALPSPLPARRLRSLSHHPAGYKLDGPPQLSDVLLGDLLFHTPAILGAAAQAQGLSCQTCHPNGATHPRLLLPEISDRPGSVDLTSAAYRAGNDNGVFDPLNIPSLRGLRYSGPYGLDGRTASLAEFIQGVVVNSFGGAPLLPARLRALTAYVLDQDFLPNRQLTALNRLRPDASAAARRGEALFAQPRPGLAGMSCATCHPPSSFFRDGRTHRLGSGRPASPYSLDDAFETPTLLGTVETAPYFHDGRFATLGEVVAWFDAAFALGLRDDERQDLTAYLTAVGGADQPADVRTLSQRLVENAAYLRLLTGGEAQDDRFIWQVAAATVAHALAEAPRPPAAPAIAVRAATLQQRLHALAERSQTAELLPLRAEVAELSRELAVLAGDWTGALGF